MDDADTSLTYPSVGSGCHRSQPVAPPNLSHQSEYCLSENYHQCPVFLNQQTALPLPKSLRASRRAEKSNRNPARTLLFIFIGSVVLAGLLWGFLIPGLIPQEATSTPSATPFPTTTETLSPTVSASMAPPSTHIASTSTTSGSVTLTSTATRTAEPAHTPTLTETATPSPTLILSKHRLDVPIGSDYKFVIHKVISGETFNQYTDKYNTSIEAIVTVNYNLKMPVWEDAIVIIPVGFADVASLPAFEAYEVTQAGKSLETLAQEVGVDEDDLKYYNAFDGDQSLLAGDWLLIPRPKPTP